MRIPACLRPSLFPVVCFLSASGILTAGTAHGQERGPASPPSPEEETDSATDSAVAPARARVHPRNADDGSTWYGWQTLLVDGGSLALFVAAVRSQSGGLGYLSTGTYALGPAVVHAGHGRLGAAVASIGLRIGVPLVAGYIGAATAGPCGGQGGSEQGRVSPASQEACDGPISSQTAGAIAGAGVGMLIAMAIDAAALSHESTRDANADDEGDHPEPTRRTATVSLAPSVAPVRGGAVGGVSVVF